MARARNQTTSTLTAQEPDHDAPPSAAGCASSAPKSMLMPTAMKNSPSSRPLNGSMSVSSSRRYSLSASSTPARKAPSAIDRPTACISAAMATTSSSAAAVKISGVRLRAIQRSSGPQQQPPAQHDGGDHADDLAGLQQHAAVGCGGVLPAQQRQQREDRDRRHVLEQQDGEAGLRRWWWAAGCARPSPAARWRWTTATGPAPPPGSRASRRPRARRRRTGPRRSRPPAHRPSRRSAGAGSTGAAAPVRGRPGTASAPRRTRRSAGCPRRCSPGRGPRGRSTMPAAR